MLRKRPVFRKKIVCLSGEKRQDSVLAVRLSEIPLHSQWGLGLVLGRSRTKFGPALVHFGSEFTKVE